MRVVHDEDVALDAFWSATGGHCGQRCIAALCELAHVGVERPSGWDVAAIREQMPETTRRLTGASCHACGTTVYRLHWHHIIQVQHGGSNTPRNFVRICHRCHRKVHPWLRPGTSEEWGMLCVADVKVTIK